VRTCNPGPATPSSPLASNRCRKVPVQRQLKQRVWLPHCPRRHSKLVPQGRKNPGRIGDADPGISTWPRSSGSSSTRSPTRTSIFFRMRDTEDASRLMTEASMRTVGGRSQASLSLTVGREAIAARAKELLFTPVQALRHGISVQQLILQTWIRRRRSAFLQCGQPGHSRAGARHQRGVGRVQPGRSRARRGLAETEEYRPPRATPSIG